MHSPLLNPLAIRPIETRSKLVWTGTYANRIHPLTSLPLMHLFLPPITLMMS
jgi:hypothetical protein